jgi:hypothetical protein
MLKWKKIIFFLALVVFLVPQISLAAFGLNLNQNGVSTSYSGNGFSFSFSSGGGGGWSVGNLMGFGLPSGTISGIISNILSWVLMIFGFLGLIGFVIAGIMYVISSGSQEMIDKAKTAMTYSAIGIVVGLVGLVIIQAINMALNAGSNF